MNQILKKRKKKELIKIEIFIKLKLINQNFLLKMIIFKKKLWIILQIILMLIVYL